jgi:hypothetical protein
MSAEQDWSYNKDKNHRIHPSLSNLICDFPEAVLSNRYQKKQTHKSTKRAKKVRWNDTSIDISSIFSRFQEDPDSSNGNKIIHQDQRNWNTRNDLVQRKKYIRLLAAEVMKRERSKKDGFDSLITRVYKSCTAIPEYVISSDDFNRLVKWMRSFPSHRGIEHLIAPSIGQDRHNNRENAIRTIVQLQMQPGIRPEELLNILCTRSKQLSHNACEFARIMGHADALSIIPTS